MKKHTIVFIAIMAVASCNADKKPPTQINDQEKVYHVFGNSSEKEAEPTHVEKESLPVVNDTPVQKVTKNPPVAIHENSPLSVIKQYTSELQALDATTKNANNRNQQISSKVRRFFDFDTLAKESLGSHWYQINKSDQKEYSDLFISLIERSYLARSKTLVGNYALNFQNEKITQNKSSVECVVQKDDVDIDIVYHLHKKQNKWMIYNIVFDGLDLVKNYESQFSRIIEKKKFSGLVGTMRKKLNAPDEAVSL